jgi:ferritin heavy chain
MCLPLCCCRRVLLQVKSVKQVAEYVSQLRRVGKGLGVWEFDRKLKADVDAGLVA